MNCLEKRHCKEVLLPLSVIGLFVISTFAFSKKVRKEIGVRDRWQCQSCGKKFSDDWMVHAAHKSDKHHKGFHYNDPSSGEILCVECHQRQHEEGTTLGSVGDSRAVNLLQHTDRRTRNFRKYS